MVDFQVTNLELYLPEDITGDAKKHVVYSKQPILLTTAFRPPQKIDIDVGGVAAGEYMPPEIVFGPLYLEPQRVLAMARNLTRIVHDHALYALLSLREGRGTNFYTLSAVTDRAYTSQRFLQFVFDGHPFQWDGQGMGVLA